VYIKVQRQQLGRRELFQVRLDNAVMNTAEQMAYYIQRKRHIGGFTRWKGQDTYSGALERLLRDLKIGATE
jgi:hypothetical protein